MKHFAIPAAAISAALLAVASPSWANSQATATLSNLRIALVDLDPDDGIAPSLTFTSAYGGTLATLIDETSSTRADDDHFLADPATPVQSALGSGTPDHASAGIDGTLSLAPMTLTAQAGVGSPQRSATATVDQTTVFLLSAHTQLLVEGDESIGTVAGDPAAGLADNDNAIIYVTISGSDLYGGSEAWWQDAGSNPLALAFSNSSGVAETVWFEAQVSAGANPTVAISEPGVPLPIPEPAQGALLAAGATALALGRRRR